MQFEPFPKLPRLARKCIISEKIDGTNAQVCIVDTPEQNLDHETDTHLIASFMPTETVPSWRYMWAASRTRWVTPASDNFGFAAWVFDNAQELAKLGNGRHFGEWWGQGIQRNYGLKEKRFSLFNAERWQSSRPACCYCVPVLYRGPFTSDVVDTAIEELAEFGSKAAPGFLDPEGVVVFHTASNSMFKRTIKKDDEPKGKQEES